MPKDYTSDCNNYACIACPSGETPKCSDNGADGSASSCICVPDGYDSACNEEKCIACETGSAKCEEYGDCRCITGSYACAIAAPEECIECSEGTAQCAYYGNCICVPDGYSARCDVNDNRCFTCEPGYTIACEDLYYEPICYCIPEGGSYACNDSNCHVCSESEGTAKCLFHYHNIHDFQL